MGHALNRNLGTEDDLQPGEWVSLPGTHITATMITVTICCPLCGGKKQLDAKHTVDRQGRVTPAYACAGCPPIEWIDLTGWGEVPR